MFIVANSAYKYQRNQDKQKISDKAERKTARTTVMSAWEISAFFHQSFNILDELKNVLKVKNSKSYQIKC